MFLYNINKYISNLLLQYLYFFYKGKVERMIDCVVVFLINVIFPGFHDRLRTQDLLHYQRRIRGGGQISHIRYFL